MIREPISKNQQQPRTLNLEPLNGFGQILTASALSSGLPSCQEERGGQFGKIIN
jgi:hypothetical protein